MKVLLFLSLILVANGLNFSISPRSLNLTELRESVVEWAQNTGLRKVALLRSAPLLFILLTLQRADAGLRRRAGRRRSRRRGRRRLRRCRALSLGGRSWLATCDR